MGNKMLTNKEIKIELLKDRGSMDRFAKFLQESRATMEYRLRLAGAKDNLNWAYQSFVESKKECEGNENK